MGQKILVVEDNELNLKLFCDLLRARLGEAGLLASVLAFLEAHEPDLLGAAEALGVGPAALVEARRSLEA